MFSKTVRKALGRKKYLAAAIPLIMAAQAQGIEFHAGGIDGNLTSKLSMGSSWRVEKADSVTLGDYNGDDGNRNYQKNDAFSQTFTGGNELQVSFQNYGAFVSAKYWYDSAQENDDALDDSQFHDLAKFSGAQVMDAYVYGEFDVLDMPIDVRLGRQVVSWGESTFIQGGLNTINSFDLSAFNRPGAKIKDAVIPVNMAFTNIGLTDNLSLEAFYQLEHRETVLEGCGTYFSSNDFASPGCANVLGDATGYLEVGQDDNLTRRPSSDGQFGMAFRYISEELDTEFGFYAMNIHSRAVTIGGRQAAVDEDAEFTTALLNASQNAAATFDFVLNDTGSLEQAAGAAAGAASLAELGDAGLEVARHEANGASFYFEYPEDIQIAGLSFATNAAGMAISGEVNHSRNVPFNINAYQILGAALSGQSETNNEAAILAANELGAGLPEAPVSDPYYRTILQENDGKDMQGFDVFDVSQLQLTAIKSFDQTLGANNIIVVAEAAYTFVHDFDENGMAKYDGTADPTFDDAASTAAGVNILPKNAAGNVVIDGTVTESAWGYRALVAAEYTDVFAGVSLTPELYWSHDVDGVSNISGSGFKEGNKRAGLNLTASYQNTYEASISYSRLSGGRSDLIRDRDFASISVGMQF